MTKLATQLTIIKLMMVAAMLIRRFMIMTKMRIMIMVTIMMVTRVIVPTIVKIMITIVAKTFMLICKNMLIIKTVKW